MAILTERGRWSSTILDERGRLTLSTGLSEKGYRIFGLSTGALFSVLLTDFIAISDTPIIKGLSVIIINTISTTEVESKLDSKFVNDEILSNDTIIYDKGKLISVSDSITIIDSISKSLSQLQYDNIITSEVEDKSLNNGINDFINISDFVSKTIFINKIDDLGVIDSTSRKISINKYDIVVSTENIATNFFNGIDIIGSIKLKGNNILYVYLIGSPIKDSYIIGSYDISSDLVSSIITDIYLNGSFITDINIKGVL